MLFPLTAIEIIDHSWSKIYLPAFDFDSVLLLAYTWNKISLLASRRHSWPLLIYADIRFEI